MIRWAGRNWEACLVEAIQLGVCRVWARRLWFVSCEGCGWDGSGLLSSRELEVSLAYCLEGRLSRLGGVFGWMRVCLYVRDWGGEWLSRGELVRCVKGGEAWVSVLPARCWWEAG